MPGVNVSVVMGKFSNVAVGPAMLNVQLPVNVLLSLSATRICVVMLRSDDESRNSFQKTLQTRSSRF